MADGEKGKAHSSWLMADGEKGKAHSS